LSETWARDKKKKTQGQVSAHKVFDKLKAHYQVFNTINKMDSQHKTKCIISGHQRASVLLKITT